MGDEVRIQAMAQAVTPTRWPTIVEVGGWIVAFAGFYAALGALGSSVGVSVSFPWSGFEAKAEAIEAKLDKQQGQIDKQQTQLTNVIQQSQQQGCIAWQLLRDRYQADAKAAQDELNASPTSPTLQKARDDAKAQVAKMDVKLNSPPCD